jgi:uncharacterized Ntn-hydrolase superfamily protein
VQQEWGVAVASRFLAVGSVVPHARAGVGAIATQAAANTRFGPLGLAFLERGHSPENVLKRLLRADAQVDARQVAIVDAHGKVAVFTGDKCQEWAGGVTGRGFAVQGNLLAGSEVADMMAMTFQETQGDLAERMLAALEAGQDAGGDRRGKQSAAVVVVKAGGGYRGGNDRLVDLRVDDSTDPIGELKRIYDIHAATHLPSVHTRLGDEALAAGNREKAELEFSRVIRLYRKAMTDAPQNAQYKNALAWFYVQHRVNLDEAFRLAEEARRLDPGNWEIIDTLAQIHFARGQFVKARDHAVKALQMDPGNLYLTAQVERFQATVVDKERRN